MKGNDFVFDSIDRMYYIYQKISQNRGSLYIESPSLIKKATINLKNSNRNCFQYVMTVALNHQNIKNHPERITKNKPFNKHNWKEISFRSHIKDWKKFESINKSTSHLEQTVHLNHMKMYVKIMIILKCLKKTVMI